jgi:hypothetical protein
VRAGGRAVRANVGEGLGRASFGLGDKRTRCTMTQARGFRSSSIDARQRLVQILDQIGHVFDPGRETHQTVADAGGRPLLG